MGADEEQGKIKKKWAHERRATQGIAGKGIRPGLSVSRAARVETLKGGGTQGKRGTQGLSLNYR
jgi:hypothetical protein